MDNDGGHVRVEASKYDVGEASSAPVSVEAGDLPWSYGVDRITAMVRDPDSVYLYWEITDEGIVAARSRLGPAGATGTCHLRIYDTTGRAFDGTNAHSYFDIHVERADREYFLMIRRPASSLHAEIGIKSHEGYYQPIARSGRADFPRKSPSPNTTLEWMTVESGALPPAAGPFRSRYAGPEPPLPSPAPAVHAGEPSPAGYVDVWQTGEGSGPSAAIERVFEEGVTTWTGWQQGEWHAEWRGALRFTRWGRTGGTGPGREEIAWYEGPFPAELESERVVVELFGEVPQQRWFEGSAFTLSSPWRVTVLGFESAPQRRVLSMWMMRRVRATTPMIERWGGRVERLWRSGYERESVVLGASERHGVLELGASEAWRLGASERMWLGASEWWMGGASETLTLGSSFWAYAGASEWRIGSAWMAGSAWMGGSAFLGASRLGGASSGAGFVVNERWANRPGES